MTLPSWDANAPTPRPASSISQVTISGPENEQTVVLLVLALIIGGVGYLVERANRHTHTTSLVIGVVTLFVGLVVASVKVTFSSSH